MPTGAKREVRPIVLIAWLGGAIVLVAAVFFAIRLFGGGGGEDGSQATPSAATPGADPAPPPTTTTTAAPPLVDVADPDPSDAGESDRSAQDEQVDDPLPSQDAEQADEADEQEESEPEEPPIHHGAVDAGFTRIRDAGDFSGLLWLHCADYRVRLAWYVDPPFEEGEEVGRVRTAAPRGEEGSLRVAVTVPRHARVALERDIDALDRAIRDRQREIADLEEEIEEAQQEIADLEEAIEEAQQEIADLEQETAGSEEEETAESADRAAELEEAIAKSRREITDLEEAIAESQGEIADLREEATSAPPEQISALEQEIGILEEMRTAHENVGLVLEATGISGRGTDRNGAGVANGVVRHRCAESGPYEQYALWGLEVEGHAEVAWEISFESMLSDAEVPDGAAADVAGTGEEVESFDGLGDQIVDGAVQDGDEQ